jgi:hypothetical protein
MYGILLNESLHNPAGFGLSNEVRWHNTAIDSGIISVLFSLGWLGTLLLSAGVVYLLAKSKLWSNSHDEFVLVSRAIAIALLSQSLGGNMFVGATGAMFWIFTGMNLGGLRRPEVPNRLATS